MVSQNFHQGARRLQLGVALVIFLFVASTACALPATAGATGGPAGTGEATASTSFSPRVITTDATITYVSLEGGFFGIVGANGTRYSPKTLPKRFQKDGLAVTVKMVPSRNSTDIRMWGVPVTLLSIRERATAAPAGTSPLVMYERTGGFAGFQDHMSVYQNGTVVLDQKGRSDRFVIEAALMSDLKSALEKSNFKQLKSSYLPQKPVADGFTYRVTYGGKTVTTGDTAVPSQIEPVLYLLGVIANTPNGGSGTQTADPDGKYLLTGIRSGNGLVQPPVSGTDVTITFRNGTSISGSAGCNQYGGTLTRNPDGTVTFGSLYSTEMYCTGKGVMDQEAEYLALLGKTTRFSIDESVLSGFDASGSPTLTFTKIEGGDASVLRNIGGKDWGAESLQGKSGKMVPLVTGSEITLRVEENGTVSGDAGCNRYSGSVTVSGGEKVTFSPLGSTKKYCSAPAEVMDQETRYFAALGKTTRFVSGNDTLTAYGSDGGALITFTRATVDNRVTITGTIRYIDLEGGFYGVIGDDGTQYYPVNLGSAWKKDGVRIQATVVPSEMGMSIYMWGQNVEVITIHTV